MTTIQISTDLQEELSKRKAFDRETYEEIIWDLLDDTIEISEETKNNIEQSRLEIKQGKVHSLADVKKELGL